MPATSKAQQRFMGLVKAYQDGDVPASKVSKAVKDAAKSMGEKEVDKYASTKHKGLPNKKERIEAILRENPVAIAATQGALKAMKKAKVPGKAGKPISAVTALKDKSQPAHRKAKGIFAKLVDKFKKKKKPKAEPKKQSKSDADFYKKQFGVGRTGKELKEQDWWSKMSADQQADYIKKHPGSKQAQNAKKEKEDEPKGVDYNDYNDALDNAGVDVEDSIDDVRDAFFDDLQYDVAQQAAEKHGIGTEQIYDYMKGKGEYNTVQDVIDNAEELGKKYGKSDKKPVKRSGGGGMMGSLGIREPGMRGSGMYDSIQINGKKYKPIRESNQNLLRRIIKEEVKKAINEGTRWLVGIEGNNGKILSTYGHYDGYPQHTGKLLKKIYNSPQKVKQMMKLGRSGISFLDKSMKGGKDHSFENPKKGESIFYGRDRGEKDNWTSNWKNRDAVKFDSGEEYAYIYNMKEKKWYYKSRYSNPQDWTEL